MTANIGNKEREKFYKIYGSIKYIFDGASEIIIKVTKETKDKIYGVETSMRGNQTPYNSKLCNQAIHIGNKIVIIKKHVQGWKEL